MNNLIKGKTSEWETIIGLEIHAQVKSRSKVFMNSKVLPLANNKKTSPTLL